MIIEQKIKDEKMEGMWWLTMLWWIMSAKILDSVVTRYIGLGDLTACAWEDLTPLMALIKLHKREKARQHRNQHKVVL